MLCITAIWGWTFLIVKDAVSTYPVLDFLFVRFLIAAVVLAPFALKGWSWPTLRIGLFIGLALAAGYLCQTAGLTLTSAANAGLLTGLFVILTPLVDWVFYRQPVRGITGLAVVGGFGGTILLTFAGANGPNLGDVLEFMTAVAFALQLVWLGHYAAGRSAVQLTLAQMLPALVLFGGLAFGTGEMRWPSAWVWFALLLTGLAATALGFGVQTFVQQRVPPARTALILLGEPAFATLFAWWLGHERLAPVQWAGAGLIFLSLVTHEAWVLFHAFGPATEAGVSPSPFDAEIPPASGAS